MMFHDDQIGFNSIFGRGPNLLKLTIILLEKIYFYILTVLSLSMRFICKKLGAYNL